jgi:exoribonuclease R
MNYYSDYINENDLNGVEYGELTIKNGRSYVTILGGDNLKYENSFLKYEQEVEVMNNRAIHGDMVYINKINMQVINIKDRNPNIIAGFLHLDINQKFGFNKKNVPYYKFTPLSKKYPSFIVPSKSKSKKLSYCLIRFNRWETTNKNPIGSIEELIGEVGDINNEIKAALYHSQVMPVKNYITYINEEDNDQLKLQIMEQGNIYQSFSIDPDGCLDIDDAFHFKEISTNQDYKQYEIGIHIANVARYLDCFNMQMYSTIYLDDKQLNMLNSKYTYNVCSLGNGKEKLALSLILKFHDNQLVDSYFQESIVINKSYSYQEADLIINSVDKVNSFDTINNDNDYHKQLINLANFHKNVMSINVNTCKLVEYYMLMYNRLLAQKLYDYDPRTILRTHKLKNFKTEDLNDEVLQNYLSKINQNAAKYETNPEETYHQMLDYKFYTHATSPIRRYVDIINQINMIKCINNEPLHIETQDKLQDIDHFQKHVRKFYNLYKKIKIIFNNVFVDNTDAYIIDLKFNKVKVFIPSLDIEHSFNPVSYKFLETNKLYLGDNHLDINGTMLYMHQKIKICVSMLRQEKHFNRKIRIKLLEPYIETY